MILIVLVSHPKKEIQIWMIFFLNVLLFYPEVDALYITRMFRIIQRTMIQNIQFGITYKHVWKHLNYTKHPLLDDLQNQIIWMISYTFQFYVEEKCIYHQNLNVISLQIIYILKIRVDHKSFPFNNVS